MTTVTQQVREEGEFIVASVGGQGTRAWQTDPAVVLVALLAVMHELHDAAGKALRCNLSGTISDAWEELAYTLPNVFRPDGSLIEGIGSDVAELDTVGADAIATLVEIFDDRVLSRGACWLAKDAHGAYTVTCDDAGEYDPDDDMYDWQEWTGPDDD